MNRTEYMKCLQHRLRRLPREDYDKANAYFEEYFEEAGAENEAQAIEDLGMPDMAADQIIREFAVENAKEPVKSVKRSFSVVWVGILAVFAAPVGLPLALAFGAVGLAAVVVVMALIFAFFVLAFCMAVMALPCIAVSLWMLFVSFADGVATLGMGLIGMGIGILMVMVCIVFSKWFLHFMTRLFGRIAKGGKRREK